MAILDELVAASFKGATFLIDGTSTAGGRKTVTHEYPNSDRRFVEDLGELREIYTVTGIIHGDTYFADRDNLIAQLKSSGPGELIHPFYGSVTVVAKPYSLSENLTNLGVATFRMTFERSNESSFPKATANNSSLIDQKTTSTFDSMKADLINKFNVTKKFTGNFVDATATTTRIAAAMGINSDTVLKVTAETNEFSSLLETFVDNINVNAFDSTNLAKDLFNVFGSFNGLGKTAKDQFDILAGLFDFDDDQEEALPTTVERVERIENRDILDSTMQINSLAQAYNVTTSLDFQTDEDVQNVKNVLDAQYEKVIENNNASDNTVQELKNLRVEVSKFLEKESVNAFRVSTVHTNEIPMTLLAYQYYGDTEKTVQLLDLNMINNPSFVQGDVKVLVS
jgi:prophage DNA circulation protein